MLRVGLTVIASIGGVILLLVVIQLAARVAAGSVREKLAKRFPPDVIVLQDNLANNFGRTSRGPLQARASGGLVLTREALHFVPIIGDELVIQRKDITGVRTAKTHLGKWVGRKILLVDFAGDTVGLLVNDHAAWLKALA